MIWPQTLCDLDNTKEKYYKHELAIIYNTYSTMIHATIALFYILIVPLCEWKMIQKRQEEEEKTQEGGGGYKLGDKCKRIYITLYAVSEVTRRQKAAQKGVGGLCVSGWGSWGETHPVGPEWPPCVLAVACVLPVWRVSLHPVPFFSCPPQKEPERFHVCWSSISWGGRTYVSLCVCALVYFPPAYLLIILGRARER